MKSRSKKTEELGLLKNKLPKSSIVIFTSFSKAGEKGLSVAQMTALKKMLRGLGSEYFVTKKTIMDLAFKSLKVSEFKNYDGLDIYRMDGSVGLVLSGNEPYGVAKSVYDFSRKNPALHFWGAVTDGKFMDANSFLEMAKLPTKEILIGRLLGMLTYPMRGLAVAIGEVAKKREIAV